MRLASYPFILGMHTYGPNSTVLESNQLIHWKRIIIIITPTISMSHKRCIQDFIHLNSDNNRFFQDEELFLLIMII